MGYFDSLMNSPVIREIEVSELNFENEDSIEQYKLACEDLTVAKSMSFVSKSMDKENKGTKKALNRKAKQVAMEATEHAQKAVVYADEDCKKITNSGLHDKLTKTHNNEFLQREQEKVGINIVEKEDIIKLNSAVKKRKGEYSPYNAVRFSEQEIDDKAVDDAIEVAEKAIDNLEKKREENKREEIQIGDMKVIIDI